MTAVGCNTSSSRPSVPRRALLLLTGIVLLFGVVAGLHAWMTRLPRTVLRGGGEFRVFAVRYGAGYRAHAFRRSPEWFCRAWDALPKGLQKIIPSPAEGPPIVSSDQPSVSIWCAWISPDTGEPEVTQVGKATVTFDNGKSLPRMWPIGAFDYREILIVEPPRDSRYLRVKFRVWSFLENNDVPGSEVVRFKVANPAFHQPWQKE